MSVDLSVDFEGLDRVLRKVKAWTPDVRREVGRAVGRGLQLIANEAKAQAPVDTGRYRASIGAQAHPGIHEVKYVGLDVIGRVGTRVKYAPYIEFGRRPGARMPPPGVIEEWASRHGMAGMGFVIARAIGRRGIKAKHVLENAGRAKAQAVVRLIERAVDKAADKFNR